MIDERSKILQVDTFEKYVFSMPQKCIYEMQFFNIKKYMPNDYMTKESEIV